MRKSAFLCVLCAALTAPLFAADLPTLARAYLEQRSPATESALREFAAAHAEEQSGAVAYLVLGYTSFQDKDFAAASADLRRAAHVRTPVSDYAEFYLAAALQNNADHPAAIPVLTGFETRNPASFLIPRALVALGTGLLATGDSRRAAEVIAAHLDSLPHPAADLLLANAWDAAGQKAKAAKAFTEIYYKYPASSEASEAENHKADFAVPTLEQRTTRAQGLLEAGTKAATRADRNRLLQDAQKAFRELAAASKGATREQAQVKTARVFYHLGQSEQARTALAALKPADPEAAAERLYYLGEANRRLKRRNDFLAQVTALGKSYPKSSWYEEALFSAANYTLLADGAPEAAPLYGKLATQFPQGKYAAQSHWKMAWTTYREGRKDEALRLMQEEAAKFPTAPQAPAALYWAARLAEGSATSSSLWRNLVDGYPLSFYGLTARRRDPALSPAARAPKPVVATPEAGPRREKVALLRSVGLLDLAAGEARQAAQNDARNQPFWSLEWAGLETAHGRYNAAILAARQFVPDYFRFDIDQLPRAYWDAVFPLPWWDAVKEESAKEGQDPHLMAGIIRQESAFNDKAVSRANARGLMQILPSTGRKLARRLGLQGYNVSWLFTPRINIRMGIVYFRQLLEEHGGKLEDTLAAYNAGPDRVAAWRDGKYGDDLEFVESIPFTETREYVQIVLRNAEIYRKLYK